MKRLSVIAIGSLLLFSCGDPPDKSAPNSNPNSSTLNNFVPNSQNSGGGSVEDLEAQLWSTVCDAVFNCPDVNPELLAFAGRYASQQQCANAADFPGLDLSNGQLGAAEDAGRIRWNESLATQCLQELRQELCSGGGIFTTGPSETCDAVIEGLVPEGGNCAEDQECADDLECVGEGQDGMCYGTCGPNCGETNCDSLTEYCDGTTCQPRGGEGSSCSFDECQAGLYCSEGTCTSGGDADEGASCDVAADCVDGLTCFGQTCRDITPLSQGDPCSLGESQFDFCKAGLVCTNLMVQGQELQGTCGPPRQMGEACNIDFECAVGLQCDAENPLEAGNCVEAGDSGDTCQSDLDCKSFDCSDGTCRESESEPICEVP